MALSTYRNKNGRRKVKRGGPRRQREKTQRRRLADLGVPQEIVDTMSHTEVREMLKYPKKVEKAVQSL